MEQIYSVGLDVGSTTAKIVVLDASGQPVYSRYERHHARVGGLVASFLDEIAAQMGDISVRLCVTGSVGMSAAEQLEAEFVQEVVAATVFARSRYPEAKALIDIGGEDAKVVFFNGQHMELRMNGNCAGGTGAFLDQMAVLMGCDNRHMSDLAMASTHLYPIAARCGVFAKTDIQNLMSRNLPESDIAASIFHSIAVQTVTTLSHGCDLMPPILLCGGPLTFLPALRKAFADYLELSPDSFISPAEGNLIPALGCALRAAGGASTPLSVLRQRLATRGTADGDTRSATSATNKGGEALPPLFADEAEHEAWLAAKARYALPMGAWRGGRERVVIGIDSGSTTTKVVAVRAEGEGWGEVVFSHYAMNLGNPIQAVADALARLDDQAREAGATPVVVASCVTGYGEELVKAAFGLDAGLIETMAHYRAAASLMPDVSFILDIGGQDMKAIFVDHGAVTRMELNEACSSGCGSFIQTFAHNLGYEVGDFARLACQAVQPCDLGTRCTVFMNSKVKQVMREGASVADIASGLSFSVVRNCLYKVLKLRGNDSLGSHIVVQGGTMKNDSVVRAFELMAGTEVARSSMPELMGAYGCALQALDAATRQGHGAARAIGDLLRVSAYDTRRLECKGCENHCMVTRYTFAGGGNYYSGNKCERVFNNKGDGRQKGRNICTYKYKLLFDRRPEPSEGVARPGGKRVVAAIPRILNMYEDYPFWHTLFTEAGFEVMLSSESIFRRYEGALGSVMSDNICFPAKLVHAHVKELDGRLAELPSDASGFIFMPYVVYERQDDERMTNSYNCPIVSAYSDVIRSAMTLTSRIDSPVINFKDARLLERQVMGYLRGWGVGKATAVKALRLAHEAQANYERQVKAKTLEILSASRSEGRLTIMLAGRPYHTDPLVQHKLSEMVADLGVNVISDDLVRGETKMPVGNTRLVRQWAYMNRIIKAGQWAAEQPDDVHFVMMTSFGCGPDSFIQDEIRAMLTERGKPFTLLKIDDVSNLGSLKLRVRSLIESLRNGHRQGAAATTSVGEGEADMSRPDENDGQLPPISRKILAPYFTEYLTPLLPPLCRLFGWDVEVLPPSDAGSAEVGLQYANNEICYPATLIVGDMVKALQSGRYDTNRVSMVMTQTGGQCRATNYAALIRRAMDANGFGDVPLITLGVATSADAEDPNQDGALDVPWLKYASIITTMCLYGDTISKFYHGAVGRLADGAAADGLGTATNPAEALRDKYLSLAAGPILRNDASALMDLIAQAAADFDRIVIDKELPAVGIVGEIFLKFNPFAHQYLAHRLAAGGVEVVPPMLAPFFLQNFVNVIVEKHMGLRCSNVPDFLVKSIYSLIWRRQKKINRLASRFRYFRPFTNIFDEAREVNGVVSLAAQFGEGWLLPSDVISMVRQGVNNVVSLQPFGCIANHVVAKGIEKKLKKMYPQLNYVSLDFDSGVSAVNVTNRLLLFLDSLAS